MSLCNFIFPDEIIEDVEASNSQANIQQKSASFSALQKQESE